MKSNSQHGSTHKEFGMDSYLDYFDVMFLGKAGMGKTTTAEKLVIATPIWNDCWYIPEEIQKINNTCTEVAKDSHSLRNTSSTSQQTKAAVSRQGGAYSSCYSFSQYCDLSMWQFSNNPVKVKGEIQRLKKLVFCRSLKDPQEEINRMQKERCITKRCELFINNTSKVRVLDVPGFNASYSLESSHLASQSMNPATRRKLGDVNSIQNSAQIIPEMDVSILQMILHTKMAMNFKFNRIVYFLPITGVMDQDDLTVKMDINIMERYFGKSIFECMVVVATHKRKAYRYFCEDVDLYPLEDIETTKRFFQAALHKLFNRDDILTPPVIFISLWDSCDKVLEKIRDSHMAS